MKLGHGLIIGLGAVVLSTVVAGCKKDGGGAGGAGSASAASATLSSAAAPTAKLASNPTVLDHLKKIGEGCTVRVESAQTYECKNKEEDTFKDWIAANKPSDVYDTFAGVIAGSDERAKAVAIAQADEV